VINSTTYKFLSPTASFSVGFHAVHPSTRMSNTVTAPRRRRP